MKYQFDGNKITTTDRITALRALLSLDDMCFGCKKGSSELYFVWAEGQKLCPEWDGERELEPNDFPPNFIELLIAAGVNPQELYEASNTNPLCFSDKMCVAYGFEPIKK